MEKNDKNVNKGKWPMYFVIALIVVIIIFAWAGMNPSNNQSSYYSKHGNFSVYFPVYPSYLSTDQEITKGNNVSEEAYYTIQPDSSGNNQLAVAYVGSAFKDLNVPSEENLKAELDYSGNSLGWKIVSSNPTSFNGFPAIDYTLFNSSLNIYQVGRDILKGSDLYMLDYYYYPGKENKQLENTFLNSLTFGQKQNSIAVVSKVFYLQLTSNVRSCASLSCDPPIGTYPANSSYELPYATINDLPEWVKISYYDNKGSMKQGYINKADFGENEVGSQDSTKPSQISGSTQPQSQQPASNSSNNETQSEIVSKLEPAVVEINCWSADGNGGTMGSGLSLSLNGTIYIITNYHVLSEASGAGSPTCYATYPEAPNWQYNPNHGDYSLTLINSSYNPANYQDAALFSLGAPYPGSIPLTNIPSVDNSDVYECSKNYNVGVGDDVMVFGYPAAGNFLGVSETVTHGKIAGVLPGPVYKFDGNIDHGNSGGVAIEDNGCFLGIPTWGVSGATGGIGYIQSYELALNAFNQ